MEVVFLQNVHIWASKHILKDFSGLGNLEIRKKLFLYNGFNWRTTQVSFEIIWLERSFSLSKPTHDRICVMEHFGCISSYKKALIAYIFVKVH